MKIIVRIGDNTISGSTVPSGSTDMVLLGIGAVRQGDTVNAPFPGHTHVKHPVFRDKGVPVAFHGPRWARALNWSRPEMSAS